MQFGFTLKPDHTIERTLALTRQAEAAGFDYGWLFDSHVLWREPYRPADPHGPGDDHAPPGTVRDQPGDPRAERDRLAPRRARRDLRRSDGPRHRPGRLGAARPRQAADHDGRPRGGHRRIKGLVEGRAVDYEGTELRLPWTGAWTLPVWVAGYGPMALAMTGRVADGIILQLADPDLIRWFVGQVREAAAAAGRDPASIKVQAAAPAHVGPREVGPRTHALVPGPRQQPRRGPRQQVPARAAARQPDRLHHGPDRLRLPPPRRGRLVQRGFVGDEVTDRFCVLGSVEEHVAKLRELADAGVDQFNLYLMNGDEEAQVEAYGRDIIPRPSGLAIARSVDAETGTLPSGHPYARLGRGSRVVLVIPGLTYTADPPSRRDVDQDLLGWPEEAASTTSMSGRSAGAATSRRARRSRTSPTITTP